MVAIKRASPACPSRVWAVDAEETFRFVSGRFVKQEGTMGTLASQREIGVCVQAPGLGVATHRVSQLPAPTSACAGVVAGSCPSHYGGLGYHPGKF